MIDAPSASRGVASAAVNESLANRLLASYPLRASSVTPLHRPVPWRLWGRGDEVLLGLERLHEERPADPANRDLFLGCGAALENLHISATRHGMTLTEAPPPSAADETLIARFRVGARTDGGGAAVRRQENEMLYRILDRVDRGIPSPAASAGATSPALVAVLRHAARREGVCLDVVAGDDRRLGLARMVRDGSAVPPGGRDARRLLDGTARVAFGRMATLPLARGGSSHLAELLATLGARVALPGGWRDEPADEVRACILEATVVGVLRSRGDTPADWIAAGGALQRVLLHASVQGLCIRICDEPLRTPLLRDALQTVVGGACVPQAVVAFTFDRAVDLEMHAAARGARAMQ